MSELREILPPEGGLNKRQRCAAGLSVKTMLCDRCSTPDDAMLQSQREFATASSKICQCGPYQHFVIRPDFSWLSSDPGTTSHDSAIRIKRLFGAECRRSTQARLGLRPAGMDWSQAEHAIYGTLCDPFQTRVCPFLHSIRMQLGRSHNGRFLRHRPERSERCLNYREIVPRPAIVAKGRRCAAGLA